MRYVCEQAPSLSLSQVQARRFELLYFDVSEWGQEEEKETGSMEEPSFS
jgi:hypothetical protein